MIKRIQILEHSPAQNLVAGIVQTLPSHSEGVRVILESDQNIYTSYNNGWLISYPESGWRTFLAFPGIEVIFKDGVWQEDITVLDSVEIPEIEIPDLEIPEMELNPDDVDKHFTINILNQDNIVVNHNLNKYPSVQIVNDAGTIALADIEHIDLNNTRITFNTLFIGKATFN